MSTNTYDRVPAPEPPDSPDAWDAPDVRSWPGVVATVRETTDGTGRQASQS